MNARSKSTVRQCSWAESDRLLRAYHEDCGVPEYNSRALWEMLMLDGFQSGLSWTVILRKRDAFRVAFNGSDPRVDCAPEQEAAPKLSP